MTTHDLSPPSDGFVTERRFWLRRLQVRRRVERPGADRRQMERRLRRAGAALRTCPEGS